MLERESMLPILPRLWKIGVLDSGIAPSAVLLSASRSFLPNDQSMTDELGHATLCLRALDGALGMYGVPHSSVRLFCAKVLSGVPETDSTRNVSRGLLWLAMMGVDVIAAPLSVAYDCPWIRRAVHYATSRGVRIVAAAGAKHAPPVFPAAYEGVIAVQGYDGASQDPKVHREVACDDSRAVMYYVAGHLASKRAADSFAR